MGNVPEFVEFVSQNFHPFSIHYTFPHLLDLFAQRGQLTVVRLRRRPVVHCDLVAREPDYVTGRGTCILVNGRIGAGDLSEDRPAPVVFGELGDFFPKGGGEGVLLVHEREHLFLDSQDLVADTDELIVHNGAGLGLTESGEGVGELVDQVILSRVVLVVDAADG